MFSTVDEIIGALRTNTVASALGLDPSTVSSWRSRKSIPGEHWLPLINLAAERGVNGITLELLAGLHAKRAPEPVEGAHT